MGYCLHSFMAENDDQPSTFGGVPPDKPIRCPAVENSTRKQDWNLVNSTYHTYTYRVRTSIIWIHLDIHVYFILLNVTSLHV